MLVLLQQNQQDDAVAVAYPFERNPDIVANPPYPRLRMFDGESEPQEQLGRGRVRELVHAQVECWAAAPSADIGSAIHDLYARVVLAVVEDIRLGGLAEYVREGDSVVEIDRTPFSAATGLLVVGFAIEHEAASADLLTKGRAAILGRLETILAATLEPPSGTAVRDLIYADVAARLATALPDVLVLRNADRPPDLKQAPLVVVVLDGGGTASDDDTGATIRTAEIGLECLATAATDELKSEAVCALFDRMRAVLLQDATLGGLTTDLLEDTADPHPVRNDFAGPAIGLGATWTAHFITDEQDPTVIPAWAVAA